MTNVIIREDCGNSPKNIFIQEFTIAFAKGDLNYILASVTDDVRWDLVGDKLTRGKEGLAGTMEEKQYGQAQELTIHHIATHGKAGAANGTLRFKNKRTLAFSNVYQFNNAKGALIQEITSYVIEVK